MAALLIMLAVMAILMTVAMPVWRHQAQREKEAELVFRGEQYARAVALYRFKNSQVQNALPASIDVLVDGRFLRKKYKDPMTKDGEFLPIQMATQAGPGIQPPQQQGTPPPQPGTTPPPPTGGARGGGRGTPGAPIALGGIQGVRSKSTENSIGSYRGQTRYDQWAFTYMNAPRPGGSMPVTNTGEGGFPNTSGPNGINNNNRGNRGSNPNSGTGGPGGPGGSRGGTRGGPGGRSGSQPGSSFGPDMNFPPVQQPPQGGRPPGSGRGGGEQ